MFAIKQGPNGLTCFIRRVAVTFWPSGKTVYRKTGGQAGRMKETKPDIKDEKVQVNLSLGLINKAPFNEGVWRSGGVDSSLFWALDGGVWSDSRPRRFASKETAPGTHCTGG